jgi:hypothetical protein
VIAARLSSITTTIKFQKSRLNLDRVEAAFYAQGDTMIDELPSAMLAIAWAAVMLVASEIYLEKKSTHDAPFSAAKMASAPQAERSR